MITPPRNCQGFSLVEVTIALGLMAFALVPMMALLPVGMTANRDSRFTMEAMSVASAVVADLRAAKPPAATPSAFPVSPRFGLDFSKSTNSFSVTETLSNGIGGSSAALTENRVTVEFVKRPAGGASSGLYEAVVNVLWGLPPGQATPPGYNNCVRLYAAILK